MISVVTERRRLDVLTLPDFGSEHNAHAGCQLQVLFADGTAREKSIQQIDCNWKDLIFRQQFLANLTTKKPHQLNELHSD